MASLSTSIPRFLLPRGNLLLRPQTRQLLQRQLQLQSPLTAIRNASSHPKTLSDQFRKRAPPVIPQPDKYRPPSHGKRTARSETDMKSYGPKLTPAQKEEMRTKKYPNMMSPEGSFSHWFFNNKVIHLWITMGILVSLSIAAWYMDFMSKTVYADLIPNRRDFYMHPLQSTHRFIEVYQMHMMQTTQEAQDMRLKRMEDVDKRKAYRQQRVRDAEERGEEYIEDPRYYVGEDGVRRRRVKRWFGIWE